MDYFAVIKKAFRATFKHKFLWLFGILAGGTAGASSFNFQMPSSGFNNSWQKFSNENLNSVDWTTFWQNHGVAILILITVLAILSIIFFILNLVSEGALISAGDKIEKDQELTFGNSFQRGWHNFWRIWGLNITLLLAILIGLSILILPVCALVVLGSYVAAWIVGILLFLINIAFWILISFLAPYALRIVVLKKHGIFESLRESLHLVRDNLGQVLVMYLLLMAIGFAVGLAMVIVGLVLMAVLVMVGIGLYYVSVVVLGLYAILMVLCLLIVCLIFSGAYATFNSLVLTLTYERLAARD